MDDLTLGQCLELVGCKSVNTRDAEGKERFIVFVVPHVIHNHIPDWYKGYAVDGIKKVGEECG